MLFLGLRPEMSVAVTMGMLLRWSEGFVEPITAPPEPLHLFVQQLLALVLQHGRIGSRRWNAELARVPVLAGFIADGSAADIVEHLIEREMLVDDQGMLSMGPEAERSFGYRHFIELTSLFATSPMFLVRWGAKEVGRLDPIALTNSDDAYQPILLGGRAWDVGRIDWRSQIVNVTPSERTDGKARWMGDSGPLSADLCDGIRRVLAGETPGGVILTKRATATLAQLRDDMPWARNLGTTLVEESGHRRWFTFAGLKANEAIAAQLGPLRAPGRVDNLSVPIDATRDELAARRSTLDGHASISSNDTVKFAAALPERLIARMTSARHSDPVAVEAARSASIHTWSGTRRQPRSPTSAST